MNALRRFWQNKGVAIGAIAAAGALSCLGLRWRHEERLADLQRSQTLTEAGADPNDFDGWLSLIRMIVHSNDR